MMQRLVDYCMTFLYNEMPTAAGNSHSPAALLNHAVERISDQAAAFMVAGFVHGVLNTDNINITGESFDYGPWRFTQYWDPHFTAAYFDEHSLFAFGRQTEAMHWNLGQLAVALRLICDAEPLIAALERYPALFRANLIRRFLWRLGVLSQGEENDRKLVAAAEKAMIDERIAIDSFFHNHRGGDVSHPVGNGDAHRSFVEILQSYQKVEGMSSAAKESGACSMLINEVEAIWDAIAGQDDWQPLYGKIKEIRAMGDNLR